jgi:hypothetical protein
VRYFDPERERYSREDSRHGDGKLRDSSGKAIGVLPSLTICPEEAPGGAIVWELRVFLPTRRNSFLERNMRVRTEEMPGFLARWLEDPEGVLAREFKYSYEATDEGPKAAKAVGRPQKPAAAAFSLRDLGLAEE